jgi:hypothetical protein
LAKHHDVFSKHSQDIGKANHFEHSFLLKDNKPRYQKQFPIPDAHRPNIEEQINEWLQMGIIQPSKSRYNSPMFMVPKKDGTLRVVQDFPELNAAIHDDGNSMKTINECIGYLGRAGITTFSTLHLTYGFWQMPLEEQSKHLTAFSIPGLGQFEWTVRSMGLLGCLVSFQRLVELAMAGLNSIIFFIDNLLLHSKSHKEHLQQLDHLFNRLRNVGLKAKLPKCEFGATNVHYLGFRLTPGGILPGMDKLKAVKNAEVPSNVKEVRQFTGLCNFFSGHFQNFAKIASPLHHLQSKDSK